MASLGLQILGVALSSVGLLGSIMTCILPMWRVTAFIGNNIVTAQVVWEGLWMSCVVQTTGHMQCKVYDSLLALSPDLQAARASLVLSIVLSVFAILLAVVGGKCTTCIENKTVKARVVISAGVFFIISGLLCLTPVCWSAHIIIRDFYNPLLMDAQRRELGASLYTGWGSAGLLLTGGAILCCQCPQKEPRAFAPKYPAPRSNASEKEYV
ncbi:claudin 29 [Carassius auratus]|uniref:Claudin n=1 Tax=Carassius auratus TaxID=7957 RepID=A0A6P6IVT3_CARAU|nr:claudin-like protein ZF-A89 [Carassius auratus]